MHKKFLVAGMLACMLAIAPLSASALTVADLQSQIKDLLARISVLQSLPMIGATTSISSKPQQMTALPRICGILNRNIGQGSQGDDVRSLQEFLTTEGVFEASATGYFGPLTARALATWQSREGVQSVGALGPLTRERIKFRCGMGNDSLLSVAPQTGHAPLTVIVTARVGDALDYRPSMADGQDTLVDFGDGSERQWVHCATRSDERALSRCVTPVSFKHEYVQEGTYIVSIVKAGGMCAGGCKETVLATERVVVGGGPIACTKEYRPVCGSKPIVCITTPCNPIPTTYGNLCTMRADGASYLYDGACRDTANPESDASCKSWNDGCNSCSRSTPGGPAMCTLRACSPEMMTKPYCTARFDSAQNGTPSISRFSGPTALAVNETGTWEVFASDPENGRLSYSIVWGDEWARSAIPAGATMADNSIVQQTTFTHAYAQPGTYRVSITVTDESGKSAQMSSTVQVSQSACTAQYEPVCGRPQGCTNTCAPGMYCALMCRMPDPVTYSNRCQMNNANASFLHTGVCTGSEGY